MSSSPTDPANPLSSQQFDVASRHHQAGQLQQAEILYRQILQRDPSHAESLHGLGLIAYQVGNHAAAVDLIGRAIAIQPTVARFHNHLASALQELGRVDDAQVHYERALALNPQSAQVMNNLANLLRRRGMIDEAIGLFRRAINTSPEMTEARVNLSAAFLDTGQAEEAVAIAREAIAICPGLAEAHNNLANALKATGSLEDAAAEARAAIQLRPNYRDAVLTLGHIRSAQARHAEAADAYRKVVALGGDDAPTLNMLAVALTHMCRFEDALPAVEKALQLQPNDAAARLTLGRIQHAMGLLHDALATLKRNVELEPTSGESWMNLSRTLARLGRLGEAIDACEHALASNSRDASGRNELGILLLRQGSVEAAIAEFQSAREIDQEFIDAQINLLHTAHYRSEQNKVATFQAHAAWGKRFADPLASVTPSHNNDRSPDRRLRIGYVSGDFRDHPVGRFILPLLQSHDRNQFEIIGYDCFPGSANDPVAEALRASCDGWHSLLGINDDQAAALIRSHGVDILIDLSGHTSFNRLLVFAQAAPIQITYLGYPDTTGMAAMDYRVTDAVADPPGESDRLHSEKLLRLAGGFLCYQNAATQSSSLPATRNGYITFGSFNKLAKITPDASEVWAKILHRVPNSRLIVKTPSLSDESTRVLTQDRFLRDGISAERLELLGQQHAHGDHLAMYEQIDIALDTFPYNGTTTTCDALAMGVPVVTVAGETHVSRVSASILSHAGLSKLIAIDLDGHAEIAIDLASNPDALAAHRIEAREKFLASSVCDVQRLAREMESAYRNAWRQWCALTQA